MKISLWTFLGGLAAATSLFNILTNLATIELSAVMTAFIQYYRDLSEIVFYPVSEFFIWRLDWRPGQTIKDLWIISFIGVAFFWRLQKAGLERRKERQPDRNVPDLSKPLEAGLMWIPLILIAGFMLGIFLFLVLTPKAFRLADVETDEIRSSEVRRELLTIVGLLIFFFLLNAFAPSASL